MANGGGMNQAFAKDGKARYLAWKSAAPENRKGKYSEIRAMQAPLKTFSSGETTAQVQKSLNGGYDVHVRFPDPDGRGFSGKIVHTKTLKDATARAKSMTS